MKNGESWREMAIADERSCPDGAKIKKQVVVSPRKNRDLPGRGQSVFGARMDEGTERRAGEKFWWGREPRVATVRAGLATVATAGLV
jgi:hypothetical protein